LSSNASAKPLEEAIKNTDLSGFIRYRRYGGDANPDAQNEYKVVLKIKSKINDNASMFLKVAGAGKTSDSTGDADPDPTAIRCANFQFKFGSTTIKAGKQALPTPFADPADQQGTGVVAISPMGPVTIAAGWFSNSDAHIAENVAVKGGDKDTDVDLGGNNIGAVALIGKAGPANYALWYANVSEHGQQVAKAGATAINANFKVKAGGVNVEVNHASVDYSGDSLGGNELNPTQTRVVASIKAGGVTATVGAIKAGDDGAHVTLGDAVAKANFVMIAFNAATLKDTTALYIGVKAPVGPVTIGLERGMTSDTDGTKTGDTKASETKASIAYKMSKNFTLSGFVTSCKDALDGKDQNRIEVKYTF